MSRDYGRVYTAFWKSADIRGLSTAGKLLANYLITSPHSNMIGAYLLPDAYIADDLDWTVEMARESIHELEEIEFCQRFADGRHIVICKFLSWNPIENPNVAKAAGRLFEQLPPDVAMSHVLDGFKAHQDHIDKGVDGGLAYLCGLLPKGLPKGFAKPFRNQEQEQDPEQEQEPEQELARSAHADELAAIQAYNAVAEESGWPIAQRSTEKRRRAITRRLQDCGGIDGWHTAMAKARASPFLRGEKGRGKDHTGWAPDLDFFLQESSFTKLMEGKYDDRSINQEPTGFDAITAGAMASAFRA